MRLTTKADFSKGHAQLDQLAQNIRALAIPRAINTLSDQAETAGFRKAGSVYGIPVRSLAQYATRKSATADDPEASITVEGSGLPLSLFSPQQTRKGVSVKIKGRRVVIPHAFMGKGKLPQGHVFARGSYGGKGIQSTGERSGAFVFGKKRLPIAKLFTFTPADAFGADEVRQAMDERVNEQTPSVLRRELDAIRRGF